MKWEMNREELIDIMVNPRIKIPDACAECNDKVKKYLELLEMQKEEAIADERRNTINEVVQYISTHVYGWQDLRDFLEEMKRR